MNDIFRDARLKLDRARHHINDLNRRLLEFSGTNQHELSVEFDPKRGYDVIHVSSINAVPADVAPIVGDAIHNLKAALDYQICAIEYARHRAINERTQFPVRNSREELIAAIDGGIAKRIPQEVCRCIIDRIQPYRGGNGLPIWHLHKLDVLDKHRLLIPHFQISGIKGIRYKDQSDKETVLPEWFIAQRKHAAYLCSGQTGVRITDKGTSTLAMVFGERTPVLGHQVPVVLRRLEQFVIITIESVASAFFQSI